jgi:zinc transport system substrate-binding protein
LAGLSLLFAGCKPPEAAKEKVVLCSFYPMYIATLNIAQGVQGIKVEDMTGQQTGCLHDYQLTPRDMERIETSWAFVANGGGMESFLGDVARRQPNLHVIEASRGIPLIKGDGEDGDNPHVWVSISGAMSQVQNIAEALASVDAAHASLYRANAKRYLARLDSLRQHMHKELDTLPGREIITFHEAFPYFAREFGLKIAAVIEREPGSEPSAAELASTVEIVRSHQVKALFAEPQYPAKAAQTIAHETGISVRTLDPAVSGPLDPDAYLKAMEKNLSVLREALSQK